jgi:hypothetical protein
VGVIGGDIVDGVPGGVDRDNEENSDDESVDVGDREEDCEAFAGMVSG